MLEGAGEILGLLTQDDLVAMAEDLDLVTPEAKLLGQLDGLAVAGAENHGCDRRGLRVYIEGCPKAAGDCRPLG
jgi:hypothetical protein